METKTILLIFLMIVLFVLDSKIQKQSERIDQLYTKFSELIKPKP